MNQKDWTILCVDDEPANLKLLQFMLVPRGFNVVVATNGETALEKIESEDIDLVLLDIMMPGMDGFEVCKRIKEDNKHRNIPIIMITALTSKSDRIKGIEVGAEEFLSKPFDQMEVIARIKMLLKVKELNDNLNQAYDDIANLIKFGEGIINLYNPPDFDFFSKIEIIIDQLMRRMNGMKEKPQAVLVRTLNSQYSHDWYLFESVSGSFKKVSVKLDIALPPSNTEDSACLFYNQSGVEDGAFQPIIERLGTHKILVKNIVCYMNNKLSVFAINYGREVTSHDAAVLNSIVMHVLFLISLSQVKDMEESVKHIIHSFARTSEVKDDTMSNHVVRVGLYCAVLAKKLKLPDAFVRTITTQASLHDVGKIHLPSTLLTKPEELSAEEWLVMRNHPLYGAEIIGDHPRFKMARAIALTHHERWDGSGYPCGLSGENIPIEGRIMAVADQYDSLRNGRIYKEPYDHLTTFSIMTKGDSRTSPKHFDPLVLKAFTEVYQEFEVIYVRFGDKEPPLHLVC